MTRTMASTQTAVAGRLTNENLSPVTWRCPPFRRVDTMSNPYEATQSLGRATDSRRWILPYAFACMLSASVGFTIAMPGLVLLNQEHDWIPVNGRIFDVQIDGESVPVETVVWDSIIAGSAFGIVGVLLGCATLLNWRHNRYLQKFPLIVPATGSDR